MVQRGLMREDIHGQQKWRQLVRKNKDRSSLRKKEEMESLHKRGRAKKHCQDGLKK